MAGQDFNEAWYKCFLYYDNISTIYITNWTSFSDFGDLYLSFIFNMLQNSLNIKSQTENMIESYDAHDTVTFVQSLGSILRSIIVFESYTSVQGSNEVSVDFFMKAFTEREARPMKPLFEQEADQNRRRQEQIARRQMNEEWKEYEVNSSTTLNLRSSNVNPRVGVAENYNWAVKDYVQAPLVLIIGALHALPSDTNGPYCSSNSTALRQNLLTGFGYNITDEEDNKLAKAESFYNGFAYLDEVGVGCQLAITSTLSTEYWSNLVANAATLIPINLAYNAGFMWVDAVNYLYFTPETVP